MRTVRPTRSAKPAKPTKPAKPVKLRACSSSEKCAKLEQLAERLAERKAAKAAANAEADGGLRRALTQLGDLAANPNLDWTWPTI
jgi:hypothetical protein